MNFRSDIRQERRGTRKQERLQKRQQKRVSIIRRMINRIRHLWSRTR